MFKELDTQELVSLGYKLIRANGKIVEAYGVDSEMNAELIRIFDELEDVAAQHNITF